jgi:hypothetical protein
VPKQHHSARHPNLCILYTRPKILIWTNAIAAAAIRERTWFCPSPARSLKFSLQMGVGGAF